jgi:hypothetical protein
MLPSVTYVMGQEMLLTKGISDDIVLQQLWIGCSFNCPGENCLKSSHYALSAATRLWSKSAEII